ncbi:peroxisome assembly protein 26 [Thalassophryne amazonica]|uniref:peroxisome assembly protein 26 n=1 Tax=Thalassophryne amazonica TaxID=390379 RepID=UPI001471BA9C|nr:peroxisome assembly protein 26 [Thalassophryne amazonica]
MSSPPLSSALTQTVGLLECAAEQLMVHREFQNTFNTCNKGLQSLCAVGQDSRYGELKASFCILGIQALAEMNWWRDVLSWVLQHYEHQEKIPAKIMQMCILLYSKVGEQAAMLESGRVWLSCTCNRRVSGFRTVTELHLLHVLMPLGHMEEARELITGDIGSFAFTETQRQTALDILENFQNQCPPLSPSCSTPAESKAHLPSPGGAVIQKLEAVLRFCCRKLTAIRTSSFPLRRIFLAIILLYVLFVRMDPALPPSYMWISKLHQLLKQMWNDVFAPN